MPLPSPRPLFCALAGVLAVLAPAAAAQTALPPDIALPEGQYRAVRTAEAPEVDGRLDDAAWQLAVPIEGFRQRQPEEGAPATQRTVVRVLYDDDALYVGARLYDTAPGAIVGHLGRRDAGSLSDFFMVALDPYHDRRSGYYFGVNAAGTLFDGTLFNDGGDDDTWDGVWTGRISRDAEGWSAELRIPYSQLRFSREEVQVWGINFRRDIARNQERSYLRMVPSTESGFVSHFPDLVGIEAIRPGRGLEVLPYVTTRSALTHPDAGNPFDDGAAFRATAGADLRLGLTSNLTLNATINPDFGQVEVDPAVVNLSAFETFFQERRPFFVEGSSVFSFGNQGPGNNFGFNWVNLDAFYSRRIGRPPQGPLPDHDHAARPDATRILGAAKVTGRLGATNVGVLSSLTGRTYADYALGGATGEALVEPMTHFGVARALREFDGGDRGLGALLTATNRDLADDALRPHFNEAAYVGGLDGWTRLGAWTLKGWTSVSHVAGAEARMVRLQRSPVHYLQRPDREALRLDSSRTSLTGFAGRVALDKSRGNWMANFAVGAVHPFYDLNDVGFLGRSDVVNAHAFLGHRTNEPGGVFRRRTLMGAVFNNLNFDGVRTGTGLWTRAETQLLNYWGVYGGAFVALGAYDQHATRGGPLMWSPAEAEVNFWVQSDDRKPLQVGLGSYGSAGGGGYGLGGDLDVTWQPRANVSLSLGPGYSFGHNDAQYVTQVEDALATATFGRRYVFAELDQWQVAANLRVNWTFSPTMSLQLFAQPLLAAGAYDGYKTLAAPRTYDFSPLTPAEADGELSADPDGDGPAEAFSFGKPDFRFASLRGNAVFRWEYRPGSALYLVWTQQREDSEADGGFVPGRSLNRLVQAQPDNVFALKLTYWLGR